MRDGRFIIWQRVPALQPLLDAMTDSDPQKRPTAADCVTSFTALTKTLPRSQLLWPATDVSYEWEYSGLWGVLFKSKAFVRHWVDWFRLVVKALVGGKGIIV